MEPILPAQMMHLIDALITPADKTLMIAKKLQIVLLMPQFFAGMEDVYQIDQNAFLLITALLIQKSDVPMVFAITLSMIVRKIYFIIFFLSFLLLIIYFR